MLQQVYSNKCHWPQNRYLIRQQRQITYFILPITIMNRTNSLEQIFSIQTRKFPRKTIIILQKFRNDAQFFSD